MRGKKANFKFKRGQIVCFRSDGDMVRIEKVGLVDAENQPVYWARHGSGYIPQRYLRMQTARERGDGG